MVVGVRRAARGQRSASFRVAMAIRVATRAAGHWPLRACCRAAAPRDPPRPRRPESARAAHAAAGSRRRGRRDVTDPTAAGRRGRDGGAADGREWEQAADGVPSGEGRSTPGRSTALRAPGPAPRRPLPPPVRGGGGLPADAPHAPARAGPGGDWHARGRSAHSRTPPLPPSLNHPSSLPQSTPPPSLPPPSPSTPLSLSLPPSSTSAPPRRSQPFLLFPPPSLPSRRRRPSTACARTAPRPSRRPTAAARGRRVSPPRDRRRWLTRARPGPRSVARNRPGDWQTSVTELVLAIRARPGWCWRSGPGPRMRVRLTRPGGVSQARPDAAGSAWSSRRSSWPGGFRVRPSRHRSRRP